MIRRLALVLALAALPAVAAEPEPAAPTVAEVVVKASPTRTRPGAPEETNRSVPFDRAQLTTRAGAEALLARIRAAAEIVCAPAPVRGAPRSERNDYAKCLKFAVGNAVLDIDNTLVAAAYTRSFR